MLKTNSLKLYLIVLALFFAGVIHLTLQASSSDPKQYQVQTIQTI